MWSQGKHFTPFLTVQLFFVFPLLSLSTYLLEPCMEREVVNNAFYDDLGRKWYEAYDHPIALLRAENNARAPWVAKKIADHFDKNRCSVLDIGCGGGFLSNTLAQHGHQVTGDRSI